MYICGRLCSTTKTDNNKMLHTIYFIYGLCVMFYFMMSWLFFHKDKELLSRLVAVLMLVIGVQCLKIYILSNP